MSWSEKIRAASFTEAAEALAAKTAVPPFVPRALREFAAHAPHIGEAEGELKDTEVEVTTAGHVDATSFSASLSVSMVAAAKKK
jgi:hypothetical protein